jgi:general secretion pathway protein E
MNAPAGHAPHFPIDPALLAGARERALAEGRRLVETLEEECGTGSESFVAGLGALLHTAVVTMGELHLYAPAFDMLPYAEALARECIVARDHGGDLVVIYADAFDESLRPWLEERVPGRMRWALAHRGDVAAYLARREIDVRAMDGAVPAGGDRSVRQGMSNELSLSAISNDTSPVVRLVHSTLHDALKAGASDIHLETGSESLIIKYRVDGVLGTVATVPGADTAEQVISRIKIMSELDIAERRVPQDGRFRASARGRDIDFRVSVMPNAHGEDAVLRVLDKEALTDEMRSLRLDYLGFDEASMALLRQLSAEPYGMLLVTGPTGSGKTTTLYAALSEINHGRDKIVTIEDPVEYQLPGVLQIPVNEKKGLTFARGLRSILRHDPDKIMVGEIRDQETAQIAVQAALTGHLVFTTVHANNVFDVLGRFTHMGVDPYSFVAALNGIAAQRLVRVNCPHCSEACVPEAALLLASRLSTERAAQFTFRAGRGCGQCRGAGYKGRRAISEILVMTDELRELIAERAPIRRVKEAAQRNETRFLRDSALSLVRDGVTTLEEINRVTLVA